MQTRRAYRMLHLCRLSWAGLFSMVHLTADSQDRLFMRAAMSQTVSNCHCLSFTQLIMQTATPGGRSAGTSRSGGGSSSGPAEAHSDSLEQLSANALLQLLKLADATQQLAALFKKLPVEKEGQEVNQQQQQEGEQGEGGAVAGDTAAAVAVAVTPRLPQIGQCIDKLMQNSCFKEAQTMTECLMLLGRQLGHEAPQDHNTASEAANPQQQQQKGVPASVELSRWAEGALQQDEPEVKSVGLAKALLEMYIRFGKHLSKPSIIVLGPSYSCQRGTATMVSGTPSADMDPVHVGRCTWLLTVA